MIKRISEWLVSSWLNNKVIEQEQFRAYAYGCELLVSDMISNIIVLLAALLMGRVIEMIIFLVVFSSIRVVCGGYHASSYKNCILNFCTSTILLFLITEWLIHRNYYGLIIVLVVAADLMILMFAPVDHPNRPLTKEEMIKYRKKTIVRLLSANIIILLVYVLFPSLIDKITYALMAIIDVAIFFIIGLGERKYLQSTKKTI
ncbi:MAG: accessory gene regulator B family protein [Lachnospiraceae bacterium]